VFRVHKAPVVATTAKRERYKVVLKEVALGAGALLIFVILVQLLYPANRSLPFTSVEGKTLGYKTTAEISSVLEKNFEGASAHFAADRLSTDAKLTLLGADLDAEKTAEQLVSYPLWKRLLPFSMLLSRPKLDRLYVTFNDEQLGYASNSIAKKLTTAPKNGAVTINDAGDVVLSAAEDGVAVTSDAVKHAIQNAPYTPEVTTVTLQATISKPSVTNSTIETVKSKITTATEKKITLTDSISKGVYTPSKKDITAWIEIGDDLSLSLDKTAVLAYANGAAKAQVIAAGTTTVTVVDGVEKGRTVGNSGRSVNGDTLTADLTKALFNGGSTSITLQFTTTSPAVVYNRSYTNSQAALQSYINDVTKGGNIQIAVTQLNGAGWSASSGATNSVVSASTYKLFISLLLFDKINAGQIHWSDAIQGTNVETCLYNTIIYSANNCAEQWISEWGRSWINSALYAKGFSSATTFTASDATHTSAQDLRKLLLGLYNQTLFNASDSSRLLGLMKKQVYRSGIPAGSAGVVADKVGFLWDYLNDAAIVYHPRGTYVLVVMTKGESWGKIAEITKQIEKIMYP
jgi:beta-lactamase class A